MYLLRRHLALFKLDLVWTGRKVMVVQLGGRVPRVLEEYDAVDLAVATEMIRDLEEAFNASCCAMA